MNEHTPEPADIEEPLARIHVTLKKRVYKTVKRDARRQKRTVAAHISFILERHVDGKIGEDFKVGGTG